MGSFGCPLPRTDAGFPEPYVSNVEIQEMLSPSQNSTSMK